MDAQEIIASNCYMTIATADPAGRPWSSPVFFTPGERVGEFLWISRPGAQHSRNIAERPEVALTIFDSHQPPGTGEGLYVAARAEITAGEQIEAYSRGGQRWGGQPFTLDDLGELRLYRATAEAAWMLEEHVDRRRPVTL